jgi:glutamate carboxypeptidase
MKISPKQTLSYLESLQTMMLAELLQWVEIESPTTVKEAVDRFGIVVADEFRKIGMTVEMNQQRVRGNHILARWSGGSQRPVLLVGHIDTVWELGTFEKLPIRVEGNVARGPGIFDMKGGILIVLFALRLMKEQGLEKSNITVLLNSDEEEGSDSSRALIEAEARKSQCALIFEPGGPDNSLKTKRRGVGRYDVLAHGRAAHAGVEPAKGVSAIHELAHQIREIQSWNQMREGISAHVGIVQGGTRVNVIPAEAEAQVDVRCDTAADMAWLDSRFKNLAAHLPEARIEIRGGFDRPPLERTDSVLSLYNEVQQIASEIDYPITEFWTGGGSDGNFTAAAGTPTLDGLGPEGAAAHALDEHILISSLPRRTTLLFHLLHNKTGNS